MRTVVCRSGVRAGARLWKRWLGAWVVLGAVGLAALGAAGQDLWFEAGPVVRGAMKVSVGGSSYVQKLGLHDPNASGALTSPSGIGSLNGYSDRIYDNGYVKKDPGTGVSTLDPNTTWNWGFSDSGQYNSSAQTLTFQKQGSAGYSTLANNGASGSADMLGVGLQLLGGMRLKETGNWTFDLCLGFQGIWGSDAKIDGSTYSEDVRQITTKDTYDVSGTANFPVTGFHGTYQGPFDNPAVVPSPVIPNIPASRNETTSAAISTSQNAISLDLNQNLYQISLGPRVGYAASSRIHLNVRPTISLNVMDAEARRSETWTQTSASGATTLLNSWADRGSNVGVSFGMGMVFGADMDLGKGFYAGLFGGYEWVLDKFEVTVGPSTVTLDGSGFVAGAVVGKKF